MIEVTPLHLVGENERGATFTLELNRIGEFIFGIRKKGSVNGCHYHKGIELVKNPEIFYLLSGKVVIRYRHLVTSEKGNLEAYGPCRILFPKWVWHEVEAVTAISFLECNSIAEHSRDTFKL